MNGLNPARLRSALERKKNLRFSFLNGTTRLGGNKQKKIGMFHILTS